MRILLLNASPKRDGATQEMLNTVASALPEQAECESVCLGDVDIAFCRGCKACYASRECIMRDGVQELLARMDKSDAVVIACPSYWADVPAQFKAFIDRCTPYADTAPDNGHWRLHAGIRCYGLALRTGGRPMECEHILQSIEHFCGHMGMEYADGLLLTRIETKKDIEPHKPLLRKRAQAWFGGKEE